MPPAASVRARLGRLDWEGIAASLLDRGHAVTPPVVQALRLHAYPPLARIAND